MNIENSMLLSYITIHILDIFTVVRILENPIWFCDCDGNWANNMLVLLRNILFQALRQKLTVTLVFAGNI